MPFPTLDEIRAKGMSLEEYDRLVRMALELAKQGSAEAMDWLTGLLKEEGALDGEHGAVIIALLNKLPPQ